MSNCLSILENNHLLVGQQNSELSVFRIDERNRNLTILGSDDSNEGAILSIDKHPFMKDMVITGDSVGNLTFYKISEQYFQKKEGIKKPNNKKVKTEEKKHLDNLAKSKVSNQQINQISWCNDNQCVLGLMESRIVIFDIESKESV